MLKHLHGKMENDFNITVVVCVWEEAFAMWKKKKAGTVRVSTSPLLRSSTWSRVPRSGFQSTLP